jgi:hypothetical protein
VLCEALQVQRLFGFCLTEVHAVGARGRVGVLLQVHLESDFIPCHFVVFFMVSETSCDELRRVAASRFFKALIYDAKVQKIFESTKHFLNFFRIFFAMNFR